MKKRVSLIANSKMVNWLMKLGLTLCAFWFALRGIDLAHVLEILEKQDHSGLVWNVVLLLLQVLLGALRWEKILSAIAKATERALTKLEAIKIYYISVFFNCCLPGTVGGDVVRVWLVKSDSLSLHTTIASVIIDRLIALMALAVLVIVTFPALADVGGFNASIWMPVLMVLIVGGIWITLRMKPFLERFGAFRPARWLLHFVDCVQMLVDRPKPSFAALIYSIFSHLCFCLCVYTLAIALGVEITVWQCVMLVPIVMLAMTIPISIGGWGVREAGMVGMLGLVGVPKAAALMISIEYGIINIITCLPAVLLWLAYRKRAHDVGQMR